MTQVRARRRVRKDGGENEVCIGVQGDGYMEVQREPAHLNSYFSPPLLPPPTPPIPAGLESEVGTSIAGMTIQK